MHYSNISLRRIRILSLESDTVWLQYTVALLLLDRHNTKSSSNADFCCIILPQETDIIIILSLLHYTDTILSLEQMIVLHYSNISFKMYSDIVIDNKHRMVTIHRHIIVTRTDIILKVIQIRVSAVSYCHRKHTYYCCFTQMQYCH